MMRPGLPGPDFLAHRMYGAGIYANMTGVYGWDPWHTIYGSTMDPSWSELKPWPLGAV